MKNPPTLADWMADSSCIDRYLACLDTLPLMDMGEATLELLSEFLCQAARNKVQSAIILTAHSVTSARGANRQQLTANRQVFLNEARMFETAARLISREVRARARARAASGPLPNT